MLEGIVQTTYGEQASTRPRLMTPGGGVAIGNAVETAISVADAVRFGYLFLLEAICTVAPTTAGTWTLRDEVAGGILLVLQQPELAAGVGRQRNFPFPVSWKTGAKGGQFTIQNSVATMGTWSWTVNGFQSSI